GRLMPGRRWSDGLHQAIEAKENVSIQSENQTLASITFQNYFRMYRRLAGMTGTADTEAYGFQEIYGLEVVVVPTHMPMIRADRNDQVVRTAAEKYKAIIGDIRDCQKRGQPVLVGTTSIENSELISGMLAKEKLAHQVLNAKQHAREAEIVAQAGRPGVITIATNMAGRGTDIVLGGNVEKQIDLLRDDASVPEEDKRQRIEKLRSEWQQLHEQVVAAGGLKIVSSERHESRRIDNRLRGDVLESTDPSEMVTNLRHGFFTDLVRTFVPEETIEEQWDIASLERTLKDDWQIELPIKQWLDQEKDLNDTILLERLLKATDEAYEAKRAAVDPAMFVGLERSILLNMLDQHWREHLAALDHLRQGIHLRRYAQKQPKQ